MSQFRDLQKLRDGKLPIKPSSNDSRGSKAERNKPDIEMFGINLQRTLRMQPQEVLTDSKRKTHRKGLSIGGFTYYDSKRDQMSPSPILSIYNYSVKLPKNQPAVGLNSNPLTSREYVRRDQSVHTKFKEYTEQWLLGNELMGKHLYRMNYVVGKGGFGKVWRVQLKRNSKVYAMKEMYKTKIIDKKSINSVMNERTLLAKLKHPFLVNMSYAFQDRENLYLVMDYLNGGDLRYHIGKRRRFSETETKFFIACIVLSLQYLHANRVIHRDIKPENLVLESNGYVRLTDLGISRELRQDNANDTSGTPGYMAPEVMCRKNHTFNVDFFALGVMGYEFMLGKRPYVGKNRKEIRDQILAKQAEIKPEEVPRGWSLESIDFINRLLIRNPHYRLGTGGIEQLKQHPWLKNIDWIRLSKKELRSPYTPMSIEENYDDYKNQISEDTVVENPEQNALLLRDKNVQELFSGYYFDADKTHRKTKSTSYTTNPSVSTQLTEGQVINYKGFMGSNKR